MYKQAFTLIELLVVVLIIGILAAVALPQYERAVMRSRYATLKAATNALYTAEQVYFLANGQYTDNLTALDIDLPGCTMTNNSECTFPWGKCVAQTFRVSCENTQTLKNGYARYLSDTAISTYGTSSCWAFSTNLTDKYNELCKREGGTYKWHAGCTVGGNNCAIYKLTD